MTEYARKGGARVIEIVYHGEAAAAFGPDGQAGGFETRTETERSTSIRCWTV